MASVRLERWIARKFRLRHVELIAEVYDCRSILKASRRLNLSQPTVTKALQDIESTLNVPLFKRSNRGLEPTPYGEIFARHAKIVLAQLRHAAEELENLRAGYSGKVTVGTLLAASASILPDAIALLKKKRPGVAISVVNPPMMMAVRQPLRVCRPMSTPLLSVPSRCQPLSGCGSRSPMVMAAPGAE